MGCGDATRSQRKLLNSVRYSRTKRAENLESRRFLVGEYYYRHQRAIRRSNGDVRLELPAFIIHNLPVRYITITIFSDTLPRDSDWWLYRWLKPCWAMRISKSSWMLISFAKKMSTWIVCKKIVFHGNDWWRFFDYELGTLEYRSLRFETEVVDVENYQEMR